MSLLALARRYLALPADERGYFLRRFVDLRIHSRPGFSQFGEDATLASYLRKIGRSCRQYIDIGANDPVLHSNTYLFYRDGASGLLVEANPRLAQRLRRKRPRDKVLNLGVVPEGSGTLKLHVMDMDGLSSLSPEWQSNVTEAGAAKTEKIVDVPVLGINEILNHELKGTPVDFASIDIEGLDLPVLTAWDFDRWRPFLFCVETLVAGDAEYARDDQVRNLMQSRGYKPLFETFANTIFVDERA